MKSKKIFWIAGENSGDLHASIVLKELNKQHSNIENFGIGGEKMKSYGFQAIYPFEHFSVMGFVEVFKHLAFFAGVEKHIKGIFKNNPPDLVILIDYPGLNMRIAKLAKSYNISVLYFIVPQFWAWKYKRIFKLQKYTDHIAYILPFEGKHFNKHNIAASFVGHPISEEISIKLSKEQFAQKYDLNLNKTWLGFLPGSRNAELKNMLPEFINAIEKFDSNKYEFLISQASSILTKLFQQTINKTDRNIKIVKDMNYEMMKHCDFLTVTSGTATIETAYLGTPFIIVYKTSNSSYQIGKRFIKIDKIGLPNIIIEKDIVPELIQQDVNGKNIHAKITDILSNEKKYNKISNELKALHDILGSKTPSTAVVDIIEKMINE
ncbi:MAG: lipid-A-disaccharide synthase [Candidatus Cloacimonadota bacterium]|nr:MAG: lipid-A-disaccharide synthase [Candidatus Cloacimonadota bacterium]